MDDQQANRGPSQVFRENLQRLASAQGLELDGLASSLGFIRDDKKWLRRAWNDGLARPDKRAMPRLEKIVARFGLDEIDELWNPQAAEDQATVLRSVQMNDAAWEQLVGQIIEYIDAFRILQSTAPERANEIEARYDSVVVKMIAAWVRPAADKEVAARDKTADEILAATSAVRDYRHDTSLRTRVRKLLSEYEEWSAMNDELRSTLGEEAVEAEIERRLTEAFSRPLDEHELVERFCNSYLVRYSDPEELEDEGDDRATAFLEGLTRHDHWFDLVRHKYDGNESAAESAMVEKWNELQKRSDGTISVSEAVKAYCKNYLDGFERDYSDEGVMPGELGYGSDEV
ncbi:MAG: hypothetical protein KDB14_33440 [Planctomycetales bacterium]|nr:hypothetical protein [Planctomycetales bacterium]